MIWNIVDNRKRVYRWAKINAVIEDTSHDNSCADADQAEKTADNYVMYEEKIGVLLHDAIAWAESLKGQVTLYLYDQGEGIE